MNKNYPAPLASAWRYDKKWEKVNSFPGPDSLRLAITALSCEALRSAPFGLTMDEQDQ
jgi:hypothetical protein